MRLLLKALRDFRESDPTKASAFESEIEAKIFADFGTQTQNSGRHPRVRDAQSEYGTP